MPSLAFDAVEGGGGDELTLRRNRAAFDDLLLRAPELEIADDDRHGCGGFFVLNLQL